MIKGKPLSRTFEKSRLFVIRVSNLTIAHGKLTIAYGDKALFVMNGMRAMYLVALFRVQSSRAGNAPWGKNLYSVSPPRENNRTVNAWIKWST
jgi:hypothetical protein